MQVKGDAAEELIKISNLEMHSHWRQSRCVLMYG